MGSLVVSSDSWSGTWFSSEILQPYDFDYAINVIMQHESTQNDVEDDVWHNELAEDHDHFDDEDTVFNQVDDVDMISIPTMNLPHLIEEQCSFFHYFQLQ